MTLLNPAGLWLLAGVPLLALLHFLSPRHHQVQVASLLLWQNVPERPRRAFSIRALMNRHLLLQALAVILLALALSRPAGPGVEAPAAHHRIVMIDTSASMAAVSGGRTRLMNARAAAVELIGDGARSEGLVTIIEMRGRPVLHGTYESDDPALPDVLDRLGRTDETGAVVASFAYAEEILQRSGESTAIHVFTDGAFPLPGGWNPDQRHRLHLTGTDGPNLGITQFSLRPLSGGDWIAFVEVANGGTTDARAAVQLSRSESGDHSETVPPLPPPDRRPADRQPYGESSIGATPIAILPGATARFTVPLGYLPPGTVITARIVPGTPAADGTVYTDLLSTDNEARAVIPVTRRYRTAYVGPDNFFLLNALSAHPLLEVVRYSDTPGSDADIVMVYDQSEVPISTGRVLSVASTLSGLPGSSDATGFAALPVHRGTMIDDAAWHPDNPIGGVLGAEPVFLRSGVGIPEDTVRSAGYAPLLSTGRYSYAWTYTTPLLRVINLGFHPQDSDLPLREAFPLLIDYGVAWLLSDTPPRFRTAYRTGSPIVVPYRPGAPAAIEYPDGRRRDLSTGDLIPRFEDTVRAGLYRIVRPDGSEPIAVNLVSSAETMIIRRIPEPTDSGSATAPPRPALRRRVLLALVALLGAVAAVAFDSFLWVRRE